jgi:hypothetical protein
VRDLPGRDHDRHGLLSLLGGQVGLGGQAAARASEAVVVRLGGDAARRFLLQVPLFLASGACWWARQTVESTLRSQVIRALVSARACSSVKIRCQVPSRCQRRNRSHTPAPRPVPLRDVPPWRPGPCPPPYAVDQLPPGPYRRPTRLLALWQQRLQHCPLRIRQISTRQEPRSSHVQDPLSVRALGPARAGDRRRERGSAGFGGGVGE